MSLSLKIIHGCDPSWARSKLRVPPLQLLPPIIAGSTRCTRTLAAYYRGDQKMADKTNIYTKITNKIISDLEKGTLPWQNPGIPSLIILSINSLL